MKPVCTWRYSDDVVRWRRRPPTGAAVWRVVLWVCKGDVREEREVTPAEPVTLSALLQGVLAAQVDELLALLPEPDNMGFEVFKWR